MGRAISCLIVGIAGCGRVGFDLTGDGNSLPSPRVYIPFDEGTGTITQDITGNGHFAAIMGATWTSGRIGQALQFDRIDSHFVMTDNPTLGLAAFSIAMWVWSDTGAGYDTLLTNDDDCLLYESVKIEGGHFQINATNDISGSIGVDMPAVAPGAWTHLTAIYTGSELQVYENGVLAASTTLSALPWASDRPLWGAAMPSECGGAPVVWPFGGRIDELRIYDVALSPEDVASLARQ